MERKINRTLSRTERTEPEQKNSKTAAAAYLGSLNVHFQMARARVILLFRVSNSIIIQTIG